MPLFKTITELASFVQVSSASAASPLPQQRSAEREYIIPVLGQKLFDQLQTQVTSGPITYAPLLEKVRAALAPLIYFKNLPLMHTIITETGLRTVTNDKIQGAYRYQYEDVKNHLENEGMANMEVLLKYLQDGATSNTGGTAQPWYAAWQESDAYKQLNKNIISSGTDFRKYYFLYQPHRTFFALQPVLTEAEDLYIAQAVGSSFYNKLKKGDYTGDDTDAVKESIKKAVANLTISKAITKLSVKVRPEGFTVMLSSAENDKAGETSATIAQLELLRNETYRDGNKYLNDAKAILNSKASATVFPEYFNSDKYVSPDSRPSNPQSSGIYAF